MAYLIALLAFWKLITTPVPPPVVYEHHIEGTASYYQEGYRTACGDIYDPDGLSVALATKYFTRGICGAQIDVEHDRIHVIAVINDRMPPNSRVLDLSRGVRNALGGHDLTHVQAHF